jgi:hypothetical protein
VSLTLDEKVEWLRIGALMLLILVTTGKETPHHDKGDTYAPTLPEQPPQSYSHECVN